MAKSLCEALGVSKNASQDEIKKAYRKLVRETVHPGCETPATRSRSRRCRARTTSCSDPDERKPVRPDGNPTNEAGARPAERLSTSGTSISETSSAASSAAAWPAVSSRSAASVGSDEEVEVRVSFADALSRRCESPSRFSSRNSVATRATGRALRAGTAPTICPQCAMVRSVVARRRLGLFALQQATFPRCHLG